MKVKRIILVWVLLLFIPSLPPAQAEWLYNSKPVKDSPYAKTSGEFGAMLVFTDKPDKLFEAWNQDTLGVQTDFVDKIKLNQRLVAVIIFSNCAANRKGKANVTVSFTVLDPQGKIVAKTKELEVWVNKPAPQYRDIEMSVDHIGIKIKDEQPTGFYTVKALVHDKIARKKLSLEHQFEVFKE